MEVWKEVFRFLRFYGLLTKVWKVLEVLRRCFGGGRRKSLLVFWRACKRTASFL